MSSVIGMSRQRELEIKGYTHQVRYVEKVGEEPSLFVSIICPWCVDKVVLEQEYLPKFTDNTKNTFHMERNGFLEEDAVRDAYGMYYEKLRGSKQ